MEAPGVGSGEEERRGETIVHIHKRSPYVHAFSLFSHSHVDRQMFHRSFLVFFCVNKSNEIFPPYERTYPTIDP